MKKVENVSKCVKNEYRYFILLVLIMSCHQYSWAQKNDFPYTINKNEYFLAPAAIGIYVLGKSMSNYEKSKLSVEEISKLNRADINSFDRSTTSNRNTKIGAAGDFCSEIAPLLATAWVFPQIYNRQWKNTLVYCDIFAEVYFLTRGITSVTKSVTKRTRPFYYNTSYTAQQKFDMQENYEVPEARTSFISGHASGTFAAAVALSKMYTDIYGKSKWSYVVWGTALSLATFTAYSRVADGEHFPTDVIAGAIVGSAVGYLVPELHKKKHEKISFIMMPNKLSLVYRF